MLSIVIPSKTRSNVKNGSKDVGASHHNKNFYVLIFRQPVRFCSDLSLYGYFRCLLRAIPRIPAWASYIPWFSLSRSNLVCHGAFGVTGKKCSQA